MRYRQLGRTDLRPSVLGLGCGNFGGIGSAPDLIGRGDDEATAYALMDAARESGITLFDTANSYAGGRSEEWIGRWLADRPGARDEIVLSTKVRNRVGPGPDDEGLSATHIRAQVEASLRRLRTDRIDLYLAHEPDSGTPLEETLTAFQELIDAGKVRHTGLSNYSGAQVAEAVGVAVPVNLQSSYSLLDRALAADAFGVCAGNGIGVTAFSPLAGGWLSGKYRSGRPYPPGSRMTLRPGPYAQFTDDATDAYIDDLDAAAAASGLSLSTLALAWVITDPDITAAIIGPRTPEHLDQACAAVEVELTTADRVALTPHGGTAGA
jgi:aryl-alcohol dehydrogenase-like predicted oxidoreductase